MLTVLSRFLSATARHFRIRRSIRVTLLGPRSDIALVRIRHGLLARLAFSEPETDLVVCAVHAPFGGRQWLDDARMRIVTDRGVVAALEREWNSVDLMTRYAEAKLVAYRAGAEQIDRDITRRA